MIEVTDDMLKEAIDRIARTPEGALLYRWLQKTLFETLAGEHPDGAFREHNGKRKLASHLMGLMSRGIEDHERASCVVFRTGRSDNDRDGRFRPRPGGRRIPDDAFIPGYDIPGLKSDPGAA